MADWLPARAVPPTPAIVARFDARMSEMLEKLRLAQREEYAHARTIAYEISQWLDEAYAMGVARGRAGEAE